ncbi:MAG TPA: hypothetical protein VN602_06470, partial [Gemmatimonadaceae bacterium]|nr:hypothetical protein [Gemmatimonadaceae bacterium]
LTASGAGGSVRLGSVYLSLQAIAEARRAALASVRRSVGIVITGRFVDVRVCAYSTPAYSLH